MNRAAVLLPLLLAAAPAQPAPAAAVRAEIRTGLGGAFRPGAFLPAFVDVWAERQPFLGEVEVHWNPPLREPARQRAAVSREVPLMRPGAAWTLPLVLLAGPEEAPDVQARLVQAGVAARRWSRPAAGLRRVGSGERLVALVSDPGDAAGLDAFQAAAAGSPIRVVPVDPRDLPPLFEGFDACDAVVLGALDASRAPAGAWRALGDWVSAGGRVLVWDVRSAQRGSPPLLEAIVGAGPLPHTAGREERWEGIRRALGVPGGWRSAGPLRLFEIRPGLGSIRIRAEGEGPAGEALRDLLEGLPRDPRPDRAIDPEAYRPGTGVPVDRVWPLPERRRAVLGVALSALLLGFIAWALPAAVRGAFPRGAILLGASALASVFLSRFVLPVRAQSCEEFEALVAPGSGGRGREVRIVAVHGEARGRCRVAFRPGAVPRPLHAGAPDRDDPVWRLALREGDAGAASGARPPAAGIEIEARGAPWRLLLEGRGASAGPCRIRAGRGPSGVWAENRSGEDLRSVFLADGARARWVGGIRSGERKDGLLPPGPADREWRVLVAGDVAGAGARREARFLSWFLGREPPVPGALLLVGLLPPRDEAGAWARVEGGLPTRMAGRAVVVRLEDR